MYGLPRWSKSLATVLLVAGSPVSAETELAAVSRTGLEGRRYRAAGLPDRWSATENVAWKSDLPGRGWSSPIVWGNRVVLTTVVNSGTSEEPKKGLYFGGNRPTPPESVHQWKVMCLDLKTGQIIWERQVHEGQPQSAIHLKNSFASETPVTDGKHIYLLLRERRDVLLRHGWERSLEEEARTSSNALRLGNFVVAGSTWRTVFMW